jgi:predicted Fe-Mo cluster-binding NifX family protein
MKLAIMSDRGSVEGHVPASFESSPAMLIWETDTDTVVQVLENFTPEQFARRAVESGSEAVVCSRHIQREAFNIIAGACVTRYDGEGLSIPEAAHRAYDGTLPIIPEYEGGPGCSAGTGSCEEGGCG